MEKENKIIAERIMEEVIAFYFDVSVGQKQRMEADILAILSHKE